MVHLAFNFLQQHAFFTVLVVYYCMTNLICFGLYGWDKAAARKCQSRIAEKSLHLWAFAGGALGALAAQAFFRHKTQKTFFQLFSWFCLVLHSLILLLLMIS